MTSDRPLFHRNVASIDFARVQRDQGWVDLNIKFVTEAISGFDDVCLFRATFPPGSAHQRHIHANAVEFFYIISGRGMSGFSSVGRQPCNSPFLPEFSIRCSTSRTESKYSSSLR